MADGIPWCGFCGGTCYRLAEHFGEELGLEEDSPADAEVDRILALSDEEVMLEALEEAGSRDVVQVWVDDMRAVLEKALNSCGFWKQ